MEKLEGKKELINKLFLIATQLLTLQYKKLNITNNTVLCSNNKHNLQWNTNTTKIQILKTLTVHWFIYNTLLTLLTMLFKFINITLFTFTT